ncbi:MAG: universal stress protein [Atribacterota bacterium]|nr:universal stress protein [Atribacterota bacterium]
MKILVCTDGSEHSQKALEKACILANGGNVDEIAIIYVYDHRYDTAFPIGSSYIPSGQIERQTERQIEILKKMAEEHKKERKKILSDALKLFKGKNIKVRTIFKEGHPSHTIVNVAQEEGFDMIIIGSEGLSGLKKFFLGSVSNAVIQEAKNCSVLVVK